MRRLSLISGGLAIVLMGLVAACGSDPVSRNPVSPAVPGIAGILSLTGPSTIAPGQSAQFIASIRLSDGTVKSATSAGSLRWRTTNTSALQLSTTGLATAGPNGGDATVSVEVVGSPALRASMEVVIVPDGTFRVVGFVADAEAPTQGIPGARVEVAGTSIATTTDSIGRYRLYGVPPAAEIRVTATGFLPVTQHVQLSGHGTRNFQLTLSGPRISLNGPFTLAFDVVGTCSGSPALSTTLYQRTYEATVTTTGSFVNVVLTEPSRFRVQFNAGNRFSGRADAVGVTFSITSFFGGFYYYYYYYPDIVERLANGTYFVVSGAGTMSPSNGGLSGTFNGLLVNYDSRFPAFNVGTVGRCSSPVRITLTPR